MSLTNPNTPVSQQDLQDFYHKLLPYMGGGSGGGGGHTIEDSEGTELTQRDTLQFGEGFLAEDDETNEKTVISPDVMQSGDMSDVITPLPSVQTRYQKYSTEEQVIGEWLGGKPLYQKTVTGLNIKFNWQGSNLTIATDVDALISDVETIIKVPCALMENSSGKVISCNIDITNNGTKWNLMSIQDYYLKSITIQYTKTTDA